MPTDDTRTGGNTRIDPAAATNYRSHVIDSALPTRESDRFPEGAMTGKSMRGRGRAARSGIAFRITLPVVLTLLLVSIPAVLAIRSRAFNLELDGLRRAAADSAYNLGILGRSVLRHHRRFLLDNPDYLSRGEWPAGDHWAVSHGFVDPRQWIAATGFELNELASTERLDAAARTTILSALDAWIANPDHDLAGAFLVDAKGEILAQTGNNVLSARELRGFALTGQPVEVGNYGVVVDFLDDIEPEPLVRAVTRIMSAGEPGRLLGSAVVVLRSRRAFDAQQALGTTALFALAALVATAALVSWLLARRVGEPIRRLAADIQAMAEGDFTRRSDPTAAGELGTLGQAFNSMAERLRVARANEKETNRLESDLAIARSIQNNLLPPQTPHVRGFDIHTAYRPAKEIGGDYFDFLPVDSRHMAIAIADASGKSIPAALVMSTTRAILRFVAPGNLSAAQTLDRVNAILSVDIPKGMFVTAYYLILDPLGRGMICSSAGHTPLLVAKENGLVNIINPGGIALGFDSGPIFQRSIREQQIPLESGDRVLLYTDGVVECVNTANEEYSDRRLREFLRRNRELSSHDFVGALLADLDRHRGAAEIRDDTTIVTFKVL